MIVQLWRCKCTENPATSKKTSGIATSAVHKHRPRIRETHDYTKDLNRSQSLVQQRPIRSEEIPGVNLWITTVFDDFEP